MRRLLIAETLCARVALAAARAEFVERRGDDFEYTPLLGDRETPLD